MGDMVGALRRRWIIVVCCLLVVVGATMFMVKRAQPTYSYSSTLLLLPPEISRVTDPSSPDYTHGNPLFFLSSLDQTRDILIGSMTSKDTQGEIAKQIPGVGYTVTPDILGSGPVVIVTTEAASDAAAKAASSKLTDMVPVRLADLQSRLGVKDGAKITASVITRDEAPTVSHKQQMRTGIMVFGVLGLMSLFFVGAIDSLLTSRSSRQRGTPTPDDGLGDDPSGGGLNDGLIDDSKHGAPEPVVDHSGLIAVGSENDGNAVVSVGRRRRTTPMG